MRTSGWITEARHTHSEYTILDGCLGQQRLGERVTFVTRCGHCCSCSWFGWK